MSRKVREQFPGVLTPGLPPDHNVGVQQTLVLLGAAVPVVAGALVLRWHLRHPIGWLLVAQGALFFVMLAFEEPSSSHAGLIVDQLTMGSWVLLFLCLVLIAYLLPDGHAANRFWRWWVRIGLVGVLAFVVGAAGDRQGFADTHQGARLPVPWLPEPISGLLGVVGSCWLCCWSSAVSSRSGGDCAALGEMRGCNCSGWCGARSPSPSRC